MQRTIHQKLVRDEIPAKIELNGEIAETRILDDAEYLGALFTKMEEELAELQTATSPEAQLAELADLLEVLHALTRALGFKPSAVQHAAQIKFFSSGAFKGRTWLEATTKHGEEVSNGLAA